ncbi:MAG TPA: hypothetical protein VLD16_09970 [Gaiellaceae bacterium]|nr:hypothetical protein [Gaiellaceae bacterium]
MSRALAAVVVALGLGWHATPARVGVSATEFHLTLSRASVKAGVVEIELQNDGQDPHDLRIRRVGGAHTFSVPLVAPGKHRTIALRMRPGSYRLWCSVADHRALGMQAVLRVRR